VVVVVGSGLVSLVVPLVVAPMFRRLSESVGAPAPSLLQGWIPVALGLSPLALVAYALGVRQRLGRRRVFLVLAFALTVLAGAIFLVAFYGALFRMAGAAAG
jgi:hypothetical protein